MQKTNIKDIQTIANTVRGLSIDGVERANSGHPGAPLGLAELGSYLFFDAMHLDAKNPDWFNRDRFVLSCGHASMLLYSLLHLRGFDLSLDDLRAFRQLHSRTPGHPERDAALGIEVTTGPLGQGFANAVGLAIAERMLSERFNTAKHEICNHTTYAIAGDGCMMEGITSEAASLAGHLKLGKLIIFYDDNEISIDGSTDLAFTEDVAARFAAYGWHCLSCDGHDVEEIERCVYDAKNESERPSLIVCKTRIGRGSPNKEGSAAAHGAPLGSEEVLQTKKRLGISEEEFFVPETIRTLNDRAEKRSSNAYADWCGVFEEWKTENPGLYAEWKERFELSHATNLRDIAFPIYKEGQSLATRKAGQASIQAIVNLLPYVVGGSADLTGSNGTGMSGVGVFQAGSPRGRQFHFGVREHGMAAVVNGIAAHGGFIPFCATFLTFSDYLRPALRLSSLMKLRVIYVLSHDSIFLGEDGPTHQPIEHLAALRAIPGLQVWRPADGEETNEAWRAALLHEGPSCIVVTRQALPVLPKHDSSWESSYPKGAYIYYQTDDTPKNVILATGSEVPLAREAVEISGISARVISVSELQRFKSDGALQRQLIPSSAKVFTIEAGIAQSWEFFVQGTQNISIHGFGMSGAAEDLAKEFGFDAESVAERLKKQANT